MNDVNMRKTLAVFNNTKHDFITIVEQRCDDENYSICDEYVRLSEWQTIEFKALSPEVLAEKEMNALIAMRTITVEEFTEKLNYIDGRLANLRALTGPTQEPVTPTTQEPTP